MLILVSNYGLAQNWQTDFEEAKRIASEQNKNIIIVFSGSDWCAPCIKLDKNIQQSEAFKSEAAKEWVLVKANFPRKKANELSKEQTEHNRKLAEKYNIVGKKSLCFWFVYICKKESYATKFNFSILNPTKRKQ